MKKILISMKLLFLILTTTSVYAQCGFLAGTVTDVNDSHPIVASLSGKTENGKLRLGKTSEKGIFSVEIPCNAVSIVVESNQYQSFTIPLHMEGKTEGTYFVSFVLVPQEKQASDAPYAQSEQTHFELKDSTKKLEAIVRRIEVKDAVTNEVLPSELCLFYTHKQKKDCYELSAPTPYAEVTFTEKDIVAMEVKAAGYQSYNGNLILDKTEGSARTYTIKLHRQFTILSVDILNIQANTRCLLRGTVGNIEMNRINDGHHYAEATPGIPYVFEITSGKPQPEFSAAVASLKEGLNLKSFTLPRKTAAAQPVKEEILPTGAPVANKAIYFPQSQYKLPAESQKYLDSVAVWMKGNQDKMLQITGHSDNIGNAKLNLTLSEYRARVTANYLIDKGISEKRIRRMGVGSKNPILPNDTEENRRLNRRVEVQIIDVKEN